MHLLLPNGLNFSTNNTELLMKIKPKKTFSFITNKTLQYFLQGLVVIAPVAVTAYVVVWLFTTVDAILPNIIHSVFPKSPANEKDIITIPGINFLLIILLFIFIGWLSSLFFISRVVSLFDYLFEHTPGIKFIYTSVKDFFEAFTGNKKKFDKPVLVNVDGADVWRVGFITHETALPLDLPDHVVVYVPHSKAVSGITYIVPKEKIKLLTHTAPSDAMKFAISGGITEVD